MSKSVLLGLFAIVLAMVACTSVSSVVDGNGSAPAPRKFAVFAAHCTEWRERTFKRAGEQYTELFCPLTRTKARGIYIISDDGTPVAVVAEDILPFSYARWSPDGDRLAFTSNPFGQGSQPKLQVVNADGGGLTTVYNGGTRLAGYDQGTSLAGRHIWSPAGDSIAFATYDGLHLATLTGSGVEEQFLSEQYFASDTAKSGIALAWTPAGPRMAFAERVGGISTLSIVGLPDEFRYHVEVPSLPNTLRWSPDGAKLLYGADFELLHIFSYDGELLARSTAASPAQALVWAPAGDQLFYRAEDSLYSVNADGTGSRELIRIPGLYTFRLSPDGMKLTFEASGAIYLANADGTGIMKLADGPPGTVGDTSEWSPDSTRLAFRGHHVWYIADTTQATIVEVVGSLATPGGYAEYAQWAPDSRRVFLAPPNAIFDAEGRERFPLHEHLRQSPESLVADEIVWQPRP